VITAVVVGAILDLAFFWETVNLVIRSFGSQAINHSLWLCDAVASPASEIQTEDHSA